MSSRSGRRRDRGSSSSRSPSPERRRKRRRRHSSPSGSSGGEEETESYRRRHGRSHRRRRDHSSGRSRQRETRERHRSRSRSPHRESKRKRDRDRRRHSSSRSRSRERTESKKSSKEKKEKGNEVKKENPAAALKARVKALLAKSSEAETPSVEVVAAPTPGLTSIIESDSFTASKFVSKRSSKKWDVPPPGVTGKKTASSAKTFDATVVDPSEFVPKVVPMWEVESALGRGEGGEEWVGEEGERGVVSLQRKTGQQSSETEPIDRNQKWLQKLKKMRQKFADLPTD